MINSLETDIEYVRKNYKIKGELGAGTYGQVFLVKHRTTQKEYACKYLDNFLRTEGFALGTVSEVEILRKLTQMG